MKKEKEVASNLLWGSLAVIVNSIYSFIYGYEDTMNYHKIVKVVDAPMIERGSTLVGASNQIGTICGAITSFALTLAYFEK